MQEVKQIKVFINGKAGSGKTYVAEYLEQKYGFTELTLADGIYDIAKEYFDMTDKDRKLLQEIGQSLRKIDPFVWIKYLKRTAALLLTIAPDKSIVVSDVRQENEYNSLRSDDYIAIRIDADLDKRLERIALRDGIEIDQDYIDRIENHESERGASDKEYDYVINNNYSFEELESQIDKIVGQIYDTGDKE